MATKMSTIIVFVAMILITGMAVAPIAKAQVGFLLSLLRVQGTVFCSVNGSLNAITVFPNAVVQLSCGNAGTVVSSSMTNSLGVFSVFVDPITTIVLSTVLRNCKVVVTTPLSTCNASLPSVGTLVSALKPLGTTVLGLVNVTNLVPIRFTLKLT